MRLLPLALSGLALTLTRPLIAQGVTTGAIGGIVRSSVATDPRLPDAHIRVINPASGFSVEVGAHHGRFLAQGLDPGGPYTILVRRVGFLPEQRDGLIVALGQQLEV